MFMGVSSVKAFSIEVTEKDYGNDTWVIFVVICDTDI